MRAYQTMVASDGYEVVLFEMPYMYISQDSGVGNHAGTFNVDFLAYDSNGRIYEAPIYAPCTMKVVAYFPTYDGANMVVFESVNPVHLANGNLDYFTISMAHASNPPFTNIGDVVTQGQICYYTGTYGEASGDHLHSCIGQGHYTGFTTRTTGHQDLTNRIEYWNGVFVNETILLEDKGHDWLQFRGKLLEGSKKFKWVLYANKFRKRDKV